MKTLKTKNIIRTTVYKDGILEVRNQFLKLIEDNYVSNETHIRTIAMIKELESDKQK